MIVLGAEDEGLERGRPSSRGCPWQGAATTVIAVGVYSVWASLDTSFSTTATVLGGTAVFFVAVATGKIAALVAARRRLRRALESMTRQASTPV